MSEADIELGYYHSLVRKYEQYKADKCLVDFFDCLIKYVREGVPLPCKVVMIDEAQDITTLQWRVIEKAFANAEKVYIAGDDKQAIFTYSGARPDMLIDFAKIIGAELPAGICLKRLRLHETATSYAEWCAEDNV
jgi:superfamily I DNA/RNA helicase